MKTASSHKATDLLRAWGAGDERALEALVPLVHDELRRLARRYMGANAPATRCSPRRSSTRRTCAWWTCTACAGRTARTSSPCRRA